MRLLFLVCSILGGVSLPAQPQLPRAMRGRTLRITTPESTDLVIRVPETQWFHFGNGDASRERAARARSIRDRQIELPVGMFNFVPRPRGVSGTLVAPAIQKIRSPRKRFVSFERSSHMIMFEEPGRVLMTLVNELLPLALRMPPFAPREGR